MSQSTVVLSFVGTGKMASAIARGILSQGVLEPKQIIGSSRGDSRFTFQELTGSQVTDLNVDCLQASTVILSIKPQGAEAVCQELAPFITDQHFVSVCAGVSLESLSKWLGTDRVSRTMPNTPLSVGKGATAFCCATGVDDSAKETLNRYFSCSGVVAEIEENLMNAITALSGSGPAYVFEFVAGLVEAAVNNGIPQDIALNFAVQTFAGAAEMLSSGLGSPVELRNAVTSPNGTTYAALESFKSSNLRSTIATAFQAAKDRGDELGKAT